MSARLHPKHPRIPALDLARTGALLAMAIFHFAFDLEMFGYLAPRTTLMQPLRGLALATASSFLFLAGISIVLAHGKTLRLRPFLRRWAMIAGAAAVISVGSYIFEPEDYIYFGILHAIATFSLLALPLLRLPALGLIGLAIAAFYLENFVALPGPTHSWTGLTTITRPSLDYVPVFPWFAAFLMGMAMGRLGGYFGLWQRLAQSGPTTPLTEWLSWPGRHSLWVYLGHQPVLIGLIWIYTQLN